MKYPYHLNLLSMYIFSGLLSKHRCSLVQSENDNKCVNPKVLENLVFLAEVCNKSNKKFTTWEGYGSKTKVQIRY